MNKREKELQALRDQQESEILRRVLFWLGAAVLLEALVLLGNRFYFHYLTTEIGLAGKLMYVLNALQYVGVILAIACVVWAVYARKTDEKRGIFRIVLATLLASIAVSSFLFLHIGSASIPVLLVGIPSLAGLIMIYYLYQHEFFIIAMMSGVGIFGLWVYRASIGHSRYTTMYYAYAGIVLCFLILISAFAFQLKKQKGLFQWKERKIALFSEGTNYSIIFATCALVAACLLLAFAFGAAFAYYALLVLVIWIFVLAVYFTSRLM